LAFRRIPSEAKPVILTTWCRATPWGCGAALLSDIATSRVNTSGWRPLTSPIASCPSASRRASRSSYRAGTTDMTW